MGKRSGTRTTLESAPPKVSSDLLALLPDKFFEVPYMKAPNEKKRKIAEFANRMENFITRRGVMET